MQEQLNAAIGSLNAAAGTEAPTLDQVRQKIEAQYAKAIGVQSVTGQSDEAVLLEIQQAAMGSEARSRLDSMRHELGLPAPGQSAALGTGTAAGTGQEPAALGGGNPVAASPADASEARPDAS